MQDALNLPDLNGEPPVKAATLKIPEAKQRVLFGLLRRSAPRSTACRAVGLDYTTFRRYMDRGERQKEGEYREFYNNVVFAESMAEYELIGVIHTDAVENKNVASAKYLLERRHRQRWAPDAGRSTPTPLTALNTPQDAGAALDAEDRLARIEALRVLAMSRSAKRLASAEPAEVAVVDTDGTTSHPQEPAYDDQD